MAETTTKRRPRNARLTVAEIDADSAAARRRAKAARRAGLRARAAHYDATTGRVVLELTNGSAFAFPARLVRGLERASHAARARLSLAPTGDGVWWEEQDADISVAGILAAAFGNAAATLLGTRGGAATTSAKREAARANGRKGGRPRLGTER
jgi:hypothetical protein